MVILFLFPTAFAVALWRGEALVKTHVAQAYLQFVCFFYKLFPFPSWAAGPWDVLFPSQHK